MTTITITVRGNPAPQGSKRPRGKVTKDGKLKTWTEEQNRERVDPWRADVQNAALAAMEADYQHRLTMPVHSACRFPLDGPVEVSMVFSFRRPTGNYRTGRNAHLLRDNAPLRPVTSQGDLDKLARSTCDALTAAGAWHDDKQVAECTRLAKVWCGEDPAALDVPGAVITIAPVTSPET